VIAEAAFPSYRDAACCTAPALGFLVPWLVSPGCDPVDALPRIPPRPLLVVHGTEDRIAPVSLGRALFTAAAEPRQMLEVPGAGHATPWVTRGQEFEEAITAFLARALPR
jgi:pimeloyl-ACP methyl ester carboxylesterase